MAARKKAWKFDRPITLYMSAEGLRELESFVAKYEGALTKSGLVRRALALGIAEIKKKPSLLLGSGR